MAEDSIFGKYSEKIESDIISSSNIRVNTDDMLKNWRRVSLSSDFLAKYFSYFFPYKNKAIDTIDRDEAENTISFILNELIENTAKYSDSSEKTVDINLILYKDFILFNIINFIKKETAESFKALLQEILTGDPEELYIKKIEENVEMNKSGSGLGYLTLMNDYHITLGFKFEQVDESNIKVDMQAKMNYKEI
jgi:hypothetical protein